MGSPAADPKLSDVYRQIAIRLGNFRPNIQIESYIASGLANGPTVLDGITFVPTDWLGLITTLRIAMTLSGEKAFCRRARIRKNRHIGRSTPLWAPRSEKGSARSGGPLFPLAAQHRRPAWPAPT